MLGPALAKLGWIVLLILGKFSALLHWAVFGRLAHGPIVLGLGCVACVASLIVGVGGP